MNTPSRSTRVVVTGIGLSTSLGRTREATWSALRAGKSGARWLGTDDGAPDAAFAFENNLLGLDPPLRTLRDVVAEAWDDAKLSTTPDAFDPTRGAVVIGLSKGDLWFMERNRAAEAARGAVGLTPEVEATNQRFRDHWTLGWPNRFSAEVGRSRRLHGPRLAPVAACATGVVAALRGAALIRRGECDLALVGAADCQLVPLVRAAFGSMKVLARVDGDPARAVCPLDRDRKGFLTGEGGAVLVLERAEHAAARGVAPYAELAGGALGAEAFHITRQESDPTTLAHWITSALARSEIEPLDIGHVNLHATATRSNDPLECRAVRRAFGAHADALACCANKSQIGHLLGAAGAAELAITCLALRDQFVPPTLNLEHPDPACDLNATPGTGRACAFNAALKISLGFGGHIAVAALRRPGGARGASQSLGRARDPVTLTARECPDSLFHRANI